MEIVIGILLLSSLLSNILLIVVARSIVRIEDNNRKRLRKFLSDRGLLDIPVVFQGQNDYTDYQMQNRQPSQMTYVRNV